MTKNSTTTETSESTKEPRTRIYILRARNVMTNETRVRLIDAKSESAALVYIGDTLYSIAVAKPKDVADAYKSGATMEVAGENRELDHDKPF